MRLPGFEPGTYGLEGRCSIQLSYRRKLLQSKALRHSPKTHKSATTTTTTTALRVSPPLAASGIAVEEDIVMPAPRHKRKKPGKAHPSFPLPPHNNGQWCKKIHGKVHFFGIWHLGRPGRRPEGLSPGRERSPCRPRTPHQYSKPGRPERQDGGQRVPGSMYNGPTSESRSHWRTTRAVNSGPLSLVRNFSFRPSSVLSATKSYDQTWFLYSALTRSLLWSLVPKPRCLMAYSKNWCRPAAGCWLSGSLTYHSTSGIKVGDRSPGQAGRTMSNSAQV